MAEIKIYKSRWKAIRLLILCSPFIAISLFDIIKNAKIETPLLDWSSLCFFGLGIPITIFNLVDNRPELILDENGIFDRLSYSIFNKDKGKGFVKWDSIKDVHLAINKNSYRFLRLSSQKFICITLKDGSSELIKNKSNKLSHTLGLADYNIPLMNLKKFDEQKFIELIKAMAEINTSQRQALLSTTKL